MWCEYHLPSRVEHKKEQCYYRKYVNINWYNVGMNDLMMRKGKCIRGIL